MRKLLLIPLALGLAACGPPSRTQARDEAANRSCDYVERCGDIGAGQSYADREACVLDQRALFDDVWTLGKCEEKISEDGLRLCLDRMDIAQCDNVFDLAAVVFDCTPDKVCRGG